MKINVSILSSTIKPQDIVKELDNTNADAIHIDIMDGKFVENKTWTIGEITKITKYSSFPLDVHLMVNNPSKYIEDYAMLNTNNITFHYEAVENIDKMINEIKDYGLKVANDKACSAFHEGIHTTLHQYLRTCIDRGSCLIKDQGRWICNSRTCDRDQLSLTLT